MKRNEVKTEYKWKVDDIFESDEQWEQAFKEFTSDLRGMRIYKGRLGNARHLLACLQYVDKMDQKMEKLYCYAHLKKDEDSANDTYVGMCEKIDGAVNEYATVSAFVNPELSKLDETFFATLRETPDFEPYRYSFDEILRRKDYILNEREERILAMASKTTNMFEEVFGKIDYIDLPLPKILDENGKRVQLTQATYSYFLQSPDALVRKHAFDGLYKTYYSLINTISAVYVGSVKADNFYAKVRGYKSSLQKAMFEDNVPTKVYENLLEIVDEYRVNLHKYVELRKKALGNKKLHMYDMYVSIVPNLERKMTYEEAFDEVVKGLAPLGAEYNELLLKAKNERWIDVYETDNKRSGAYSMGVAGVHPFVLLNHTNTLHDAFIVAHELGHAMHSYYSTKEQPYVTSHYSIFVAEVASTVNEVLLLKHMIKNAKNREEKKYLLNYYLEMFRTTLFRQTMFAEFEKIAHEMEANGEPLTPKTLSGKYYKLNKKYYGSQVTHDNLIRYEWARIPHFYSAFYVYKYATGLTAAVNIARDILKNGDEAVEKYKKFLKSGGSDSPYELLKIAGVDLIKKMPFREAMEEFKDTLEELISEFGYEPCEFETDWIDENDDEEVFIKKFKYRPDGDYENAIFDDDEE